MIEQVMYFVLGVLIATLAALLVLPAVWHRAVRLTTRRVEAALPVSLFEVQADKDQQRATFALVQRRLELQIEAMREIIVAQAAAIERQRIAALEAAPIQHEAIDEMTEQADSDAVLRTALAELAAQVAAMTAQTEGPASPIPALVADAPRDTLAGRIRVLLDEKRQAAE